MVVFNSSTAQMEKLDQQILDLMEQRALLYGEEVDKGRATVDDEEIVDLWVESGMERGLDEAAVERVCRAVLALSRKAAE
ncbi:hypothetical protein A3H22_01330 [Candidatus Peribacteria bacterium RIFCSPLOWO2_12_FULL_55_15]|nr:MAG: hypothetical protein A2789_02130 [Candidatus Peribacteria bacterium RIFCSPHIGHO2_01_FULL_54_22]OGJ63461.1 MAG: hypothetical protein A3D12_01805 [Candidatus Peribacteria bacterium RIFCSPHIGHO2_02_FULL_55_24]OGJ64821.1 MAG: hypothetical protein A3E47_00980 [Candidatus Peribacteria bacterium RIFCSPHIGHO2_12_FULL_54_10]OGJ68693.1 MAG: hypothetical protein A2947_00845 [Candidatus Peribacteria bacterium RIFCSPLOWO2_01_FULL_54_110]OGJ68717.1 MAG: hypothetical protein A3H90_00170 [Candidatus Pe